MKKIKLSQIIGRQLSRLKAGQSYYMIVISTITTLGIVNLAFPEINLLILIFLFPFALFGAYLIGYFLDKSNVVTMDQQKTIEMTHRYLTTADYKNNEFRLLQMETMFEWFKALQENKPPNPDILKERYKEFLKKWNPPNRSDK